MQQWPVISSGTSNSFLSTKTNEAGAEPNRPKKDEKERREKAPEHSSTGTESAHAGHTAQY